MKKSFRDRVSFLKQSRSRTTGKLTSNCSKRSFCSRRTFDCVRRFFVQAAANLVQEQTKREKEFLRAQASQAKEAPELGICTNLHESTLVSDSYQRSFRFVESVVHCEGTGGPMGSALACTGQDRKKTGNMHEVHADCR